MLTLNFKNSLYTKAVLITAFFFVASYNSGCAHKTAVHTPQIKIIPNSIVLYNLNASCLAKEYFLKSDLIFFPFLEISKKGQLIENYNQIYNPTTNSSYLNSRFEFEDGIVQVVASKLHEEFKFKSNLYINEIPNDINKAYFFKFYYHTNSINNNRYNIYLSCSVEYFDSNNTEESLKTIWSASSHYNFYDQVTLNDAKKIALKHLISFFLKSSSENNQFNIYDN